MVAANQNVLVTGGGGFVGSHLVDSLLAKGFHVRTIDLNFDRLRHVYDHPNLEIVAADITNDESIAPLFSNIQVVYHLASAHLDISLPDERYWQVNVDATRNLLRAARAAGVEHVVHCSSNSVVGQITRPPVDETVSCHPANIYATTKLAGEKAALDCFRDTGLPVTIARLSWVYGPRCPRTRKLFHAVSSGRFIMFGDGKTLRHPIYVDEAVKALELCASVPDAAGEVYFVAGDTIVTIEDMVRQISHIQGVRTSIVRLPMTAGLAGGYLLEKVAPLMRRPPPLTRRSFDFFRINNAYNIDKARHQLGFRPEIDLQAGLDKTYESLRRTEAFI